MELISNVSTQHSSDLQPLINMPYNLIEVHVNSALASWIKLD